MICQYDLRSPTYLSLKSHAIMHPSIHLSDLDYWANDEARNRAARAR